MRKRLNSQATVDALCLEHLPWAKGVAAACKRKLPDGFALEDLQQEACLGLLKAAELYDRRKNDNFRGFAYRYVRGAVMMSARRKAYVEATHEQLPAVMPAAPVVPSADVTESDPRLATIAQEVDWHMEQSRVSARATVAHCASIGVALMRAKGLMPHGEFGTWTQESLGISRATASRYMRLADRTNVARVLQMAGPAASMRQAMAALVVQREKTGEERWMLIATLDGPVETTEHMADLLGHVSKWRVTRRIA